MTKHTVRDVLHVGLQLGSEVHFVDLKDEKHFRVSVQIHPDVWDSMGCPNEITVSIERGDKVKKYRSQSNEMTEEEIEAERVEAERLWEQDEKDAAAADALS